MKIRNGFVSNSSSSSFVIALDTNPMEMTMEELRTLLFGEQELFAKYDYAFTTKDLAQTILKDIQECHEREEKETSWGYNANCFEGKLSKEGLIETICSGDFDGSPEYIWRDRESDKIEDEAKRQGITEPYKDPKWNKLIHEARDKEYAEHDRLTKIAATELADPFWEANKDKYLYALEYSDNEGQKGCVLEHGNVFRNIPHIQISHH